MTVFSIVGKTIKGRRYFYLRRQRRRGGKLKQKDFCLGRMGIDAVPKCLAPGADLFAMPGDTPDLKQALIWWQIVGKVADNLMRDKSLHTLSRRDQKFFRGAKRKVVAIEKALAGGTASGVIPRLSKKERELFSEIWARIWEQSLGRRFAKIWKDRLRGSKFLSFV